MLEKPRKKKIIESFKVHSTDTGSPNVQIAIMTERINQLSEEHFKKYPKDHASRRGLLRLVSKRRQLLNYLKEKNPKSYSEIIGKLDIRK
ncbi:MAG: 30S ribosomal protein S15 [Elusimicrobia bacterium RIFOXYC2_FULL_34_12]|nr:MAG: 30S ribosomal protein S15 [Elusimicrobia bacterium RIFOXYC2_FULL_34_12]OGS38645.1 MAG: 30S ribosomal protein S15 [Elusimicrobia bacterium RIFOXYD2_FULL_34_30]HAM39480.1 30S ribosomal protein S15 [Elusimicrobiota bacterium]